MNLLQRLLGLELLVISGKGGVGKTTLAATLGHCLARRGKRVLLLETDPRESLYHLLDVEPSGGEIVEVVEGLFVQNLNPRSVLDEMVREKLKVKLFVDRVLSSSVYEHFTEGAPGLKELAVLSHTIRVVAGQAGRDTPEIDLVVLDAPATGHGTSMLSAPALVSEVIRDGPIGRAGGELAEFVADPQRFGVLLATAAEEMPVQEAIEHVAALERQLARRPELMLVNGVYPQWDGASGDDEDPLIALWRDRRRVNDRELTRLARNWSGPRIDLPLLPFDRGVQLVRALQEPMQHGLLEATWS